MVILQIPIIHGQNFWYCKYRITLHGETEIKFFPTDKCWHTLASPQKLGLICVVCGDFVSNCYNCV